MTAELSRASLSRYPRTLAEAADDAALTLKTP